MSCSWGAGGQRAAVGVVVSRCSASSGDSPCSICTTVQCIHSAQTAMRRKSTKKVRRREARTRPWCRRTAGAGRSRRGRRASRRGRRRSRRSRGSTRGCACRRRPCRRPSRSRGRRAGWRTGRSRASRPRCEVSRPSAWSMTMWPFGIISRAEAPSMTPKAQYMTRRAPQPVGEPAADRAQQRGREDVERGQQPGRGEGDPEVVDVVLRQPGREGDVGAEERRRSRG